MVKKHKWTKNIGGKNVQVKVLKIGKLNSDKSPKDWFLPEAYMIVWRLKYPCSQFLSDSTRWAKGIWKYRMSGNVLEQEWIQTWMNR